MNIIAKAFAVGVLWNSDEGVQLAKKISSKFTFAGVYVHFWNLYSTQALGTNVKSVQMEEKQ